MRILSVFIFAAVLFMSNGCSQKLPEGMPKPYPAKIKVILDQAPLENARVTAFPVDTTLSKWGSGGGSPTNSSGVAEMYTHGIRGMIEGEFVVVVEKDDVEYNLNDHTGNSNLYKFYVDTKYWRQDTSPLRITVGPGQPREFTVEVEKFDEKTYDIKKFYKKLMK